MGAVGSGVGHGSAGLRRIRNGSRKGHTRPQHVFFKGEATAVEKEASFSFAEIKQQLGAGQWLQMLPVLLAIGGFLGLFLFGSVAAWLGIENKLMAGLVAIVALYALARAVIALVRA